MKKSLLEQLTSEQIEEITRHAELRRDIPLVQSPSIEMSLPMDILNKAMDIAQSQNIPYTTFLAQLIQEDVERLWTIYTSTKASKKL